MLQFLLIYLGECLLIAVAVSSQHTQVCNIVEEGYTVKGRVSGLSRTKLVDECCQECYNANDCEAFQFNTNSGHCILLTKVAGHLVGTRYGQWSSIVSGYLTSSRNAKAHGPSFRIAEPHRQYPDRNQQQTAPAQQHPEQPASNDIVAHPKCQAWTFYSHNFPPVQVQCSLKMGVPSRGSTHWRRNRNAVTGRKGTAVGQQQEGSDGLIAADSKPAETDPCSQSQQPCGPCQTCQRSFCHHGQQSCFSCENDSRKCRSYQQGPGFPGAGFTHPGHRTVFPGPEVRSDVRPSQERVAACQPNSCPGDCIDCVPMNRVCFQDQCPQFECITNRSCIQQRQCAQRLEVQPCTTLQECRLVNDQADHVDCVAKPIYDPTIPPRCRQPIEQGRCKAYFPVFGYDASSRTCVQFIYGGCEGNTNQFATKQECDTACARDTNLELQCGTSTPRDCTRERRCYPQQGCPGGILMCCQNSQCGFPICTEPIVIPSSG